MPAVVGTDNSPTFIPICCSMYFSDFMSDGAALKSLVASSLTNFTLRSAARSTDGTAAAMSRLTTLVSAGDADSTGNGSSGAFGNASSSATAVAAAGVAAGVDFGVGRGTGGGAADGSGVSSTLMAIDFPLRGLSHFSQRIPC